MIHYTDPPGTKVIGGSHFRTKLPKLPGFGPPAEFGISLQHALRVAPLHGPTPFAQGLVVPKPQGSERVTYNNKACFESESSRPFPLWEKGTILHLFEV